MVPMLTLFAVEKRVSRCAPFAGGGLSQEDLSSYACPGQISKVSSNVLPALSQRVDDPLYVFLKFVGRHRLVLMPPLPGLEKVLDLLSTRIAFLRLTDPIDRVLAA